MRKLTGIILTLFAGAILSGCCTPKIVYKTEIRTEYKDRVVHDTAEVEIPVIIEKNVTRDTFSSLENKYAKSDAVVSDGFLSHSLETKPQKIQAPITIHVTDTLYVEKSEGELHPVQVPVEKELSWSQKVKLDLFWWLFSYTVVTLLWFFRKPLLGLIKKI